MSDNWFGLFDVIVVVVAFGAWAIRDHFNLRRDIRAREERERALKSQPPSDHPRAE